MKKLIGITSLLLSMTLVSCGNQGGNNVDPVDPKTPYHTEVWDNTIKMMLDKFTDEASKVIPVIPASEYYCAYVNYSGYKATQVSAYNVDYRGIEAYYTSELEKNDFLIYNGSYSDGTPHRYAYRLANPTDDLKVEFALGNSGETPVFSIVVYQATNRQVAFPTEDIKYLFGKEEPYPAAESYEAYFDNVYDSYMVFAHNVKDTEFNDFATKLSQGGYHVVSEFTSAERYYFTSNDGYNNITFYNEYDEYQRLSMVVSYSTNSFRIATLRYLNNPLPNFTETLDERTSFVISEQVANTFIIYFGPTTKDFYESYCTSLIQLGWKITKDEDEENLPISRTCSKGGYTFSIMFGVMGDTQEETIVIAITIPEEN